MCCFSRPVKHVGGTSIFARDLGDERQALVYEMSLETDESLAMILPLPVPPGSAEDAVDFVSLEAYPALFRDMARAFPSELELSRGGLAPQSLRPHRLKVHAVGAFEASFVPSVADFARLDERFRLPPDVWDRLPRYADWGFAVFKLAAAEPGFWSRLFRRGARGQRVHPMAFRFVRRDPSRLFFPTVHVHDGKVHARADFDHVLYCQPDPVLAATLGWERSDERVGASVRDTRTEGLVDGDARVYRHMMIGSHDNEDQVLRSPRCAHPERLRRRMARHELAIRGAAANGWSPGETRWRQTALEHLDCISAALPELVEAALDGLEAQPIADDPGASPVDFERKGIDGVFRSPFMFLEGTPLEGSPRTPKPGVATRVRFAVSTSRIEPQHIWLTFAEAPSVRVAATIHDALVAVLEQVPLPA